jgi:N-acetyl-gamma-glutamyl-phosphate reductase
MGARAVVLGGSGFAGAELLRLLARHPGIEVVGAAASSQVGRRVVEAYPALGAYGDLVFVSVEEALGLGPDVVFSSLPHGESMKLFGGKVEGKVVDLAGDFRLADASLYPEWYGGAHVAPGALGEWVYGLTEFHRDEIRAADKVANPGCYPAACLLALTPLISAGVFAPGNIQIVAVSGVSGAGRAGGEGFDFASVNENVRAYSPVGHKHVPEIEQELSLKAGEAVKVSFVPQLAPMTRGILAVCSGAAAGGVSERQLIEVLQGAYRGEPLVRVLGTGELPETKRLSGTNFAEVSARFDARTNTVLAFGAIDNLGKGAAGQALQNANLMLGFEETTALLEGGLAP